MKLTLLTIPAMTIFAIAGIAEFNAPTVPEPDTPYEPVKASSAFEEAFGSYEGTVKTEWLPNGQMRLLENFVYTDPDGNRWSAPKGAMVNGASIPPTFWSILGSPYTGKYRAASVIHDVACIEKKQPSDKVHLAFYYAMRASGVPDVQAKIMYAAVYNFGPRWQMPHDTAYVSKSFRTAAPQLTPAQFEALTTQITQAHEHGESLTLESIRDFGKH